MNVIYGLSVTFYVVICLFLMLIVLVQKSKGSMGLGSMGGGSQMLFGGSGGQDIFQKTTWVLGTIFMVLSFLLALMKSHQSQTFRYVKAKEQAPYTRQQEQTAPIEAKTTTSETE